MTRSYHRCVALAVLALSCGEERDAVPTFSREEPVEAEAPAPPSPSLAPLAVTH